MTLEGRAATIVALFICYRIIYNISLIRQFSLNSVSEQLRASYASCAFFFLHSLSHLLVHSHTHTIFPPFSIRLQLDNRIGSNVIDTIQRNSLYKYSISLSLSLSHSRSLPSLYQCNNSEIKLSSLKENEWIASGSRGNIFYYYYHVLKYFLRR